jgi:ABC-type phosphate transport system permease subunit
MKKQILLLFALLATVAVTAQDSLHHIPELVNVGVAALTATNNTIIPGVDNTVSGSLITALILGIVRFFEKRKIKRNQN